MGPSGVGPTEHSFSRGARATVSSPWDLGVSSPWDLAHTRLGSSGWKPRVGRAAVPR